MNKMQYIKLLNLRGIADLEKGQTIASAMTDSGGEPTMEEMVEVNKQCMTHYIEKFTESKADNEKLSKQVDKLTTEVEKLTKRDEWLMCLEQAGVDNWSEYSNAVDISNGDY